MTRRPKRRSRSRRARMAPRRNASRGRSWAMVMAADRRRDVVFLRAQPSDFSGRGNMISQDLLDILRCPLSPKNTRLRLTSDGLECERCALCFAIKDGFPILVVEEAALP